MIWSLKDVPELSEEQFVMWSKLLEERAGIYLSSHQRTFIQTHVSMRMRQLGFENFGDYYNCVTDGLAGKVEWSQLIDRLVVQETQFFRHQDSIDFVGRYLTKHLVKKADSTSFDVWSVGCSSGEEPYTLAMTINDAYERAGFDPRYAITGTDISRAALSLGRTGIYSLRKVEMVGNNFRERYFNKVGDNQFQVSPLLQDRICFTQGNVLNINEMPTMKLDTIYCQNLLVYFRRWLREQILDAFAERLKPGGVIVIGLGEVVGWSHPDMERVPNDSVQVYIHN